MPGWHLDIPEFHQKQLRYDAVQFFDQCECQEIPVCGQDSGSQQNSPPACGPFQNSNNIFIQSF